MLRLSTLWCSMCILRTLRGDLRKRLRFLFDFLVYLTLEIILRYLIVSLIGMA